MQALCRPRNRAAKPTRTTSEQSRILTEAKTNRWETATRVFGVGPGRGLFASDQRGQGKSEAFPAGDRKSTRLNSSHGYISYAVFCLKKKKKKRCCETQKLTGPANTAKKM